MFLSERREFPSAPCLAGKETWSQLASRFCWSRSRPWHASEIVSFLVGLKTYQHHGINVNSGAFAYCCRGEAIIIECVGVCLCSLSYPPCKAHAPYYFVICGLSVPYHIFHIISHKARFRGAGGGGRGITELNWLSLQCSSAACLILRAAQLHTIIDVHNLDVKYPLLLSDNNKVWIPSIDFRKIF